MNILHKFSKKYFFYTKIGREFFSLIKHTHMSPIASIMLSRHPAGKAKGHISLHAFASLNKEENYIQG